ncbi:MAG: chemotaxis protein CheX [Spirochaetales bacterium]|nr:chemotaxis protein CheX [Spirochaetales bacterium]
MNTTNTDINTALQNRFETACTDIFTENKLTITALVPSDAILKNLQVIATVGLTSDIQGNLFLGCSHEAVISLSRDLYSAQGIKADPKSIETLARSTLGEITNQVAGRAIMYLTEIDLDCNITPPTVFSGNALQSELYAAEHRFGLIINGTFGDIILHVEIKNMKKKTE